MNNNYNNNNNKKKKLKLCFLIFECKLTVSKNFFQILNDLFFTRENYKTKFKTS